MQRRKFLESSLVATAGMAVGTSSVTAGNAGDKLPRLTYLLTCESMEARDKGWVAFIADPAWKKLVGDPQYANTISKISNSFLIPTAYSQV